ncbi:hypothetical protein MMG85_07975 [Pseudoxanthomonas sp. LH2527]|uniref:hypothetical protein n=1 Tax=Pseudoxanthomonas sp. LH2527 TaxID=2923249 RepID=UPI001F147206|nr:hypothetical protein [Pseudoxanthomonas sp. LH2527]MCH6483504.1 hypothetical protein [Pseudoxanthomonas sp. LH2527]
MRMLLLACGLCIATMAQAQSPSDYATAKQQADRDEASLPATDAGALRDAQRLALDAAISGCATPTADTSPFVVVAELDASGQVVRTWREGGTPLAICVQKQIRGSTLSAPPRAPFFTSFELSFTP